MTTFRNPFTPPRWLAGLLVALALLGGCGGGVGEGGTGGGYAQGSISGFGSVIVNEVRYDDSAAQVLDSDGTLRSSADLKLGMTVEIDSSAITQSGGGAVASASRIRYASELLGPLAAVDAVAGRLTLLGQTVQIDATTVFDDRLAGGLAALAPGQVVEVYAAFDPASGRYRATRVEPHPGVAASYRLRGVVSQLDSGARSLHIGAATFGYAAAANVPAALANGQFVRLQLQPAAAASSSWQVLAFGSSGGTPPEGLEAKVKGLISAYATAVDFSVNGARVDGSGASFPDGTAALAVGVRVEVEGRVQGGVLRATQVSIESDDEVRDRGFELKGLVSGLDTVARTFVIRGVLVSYASPSLVFKDNRSAADLANGRFIEVKGGLGLDRITLVASEIDFSP